MWVFSLAGWDYDVSDSVTIVVDPSVAFSVQNALLVVSAGRPQLGLVKVGADIDLAFPGPDDLVSLTFDGAELFSAPFSAFRDSRRDGVKFLLKNRTLVRWNYNTNRILVNKRKTNLGPVNLDNGVDIEFMAGNIVVVDQIDMTQTNPRVWRYQAPQPN